MTPVVNLCRSYARNLTTLLDQFVTLEKHDKRQEVWTPFRYDMQYVVRASMILADWLEERPGIRKLKKTLITLYGVLEDGLTSIENRSLPIQELISTRPISFLHWKLWRDNLQIMNRAKDAKSCLQAQVQQFWDAADQLRESEALMTRFGG